MPPARRGEGQCKAGYQHAMKMRRVCVKIGGRIGQGMGRETGRAGMGKGPGGACKYGFSERTGKCRTKTRFLQNKRGKKNKAYIRRKGLVVPSPVKPPGARVRRGDIVMGGRNMGRLGY